MLGISGNELQSAAPAAIVAKPTIASLPNTFQVHTPHVSFDASAFSGFDLGFDLGLTLSLTGSRPIGWCGQKEPLPTRAGGDALHGRQVRDG